MILDLPPQTVQIITQKAQAQGISAEQWAIDVLTANANIDDKKSSGSVLDFVKGKTLSSFGDPLEFQKRVRDEWDR